ncbi:unnamed protein product, partial [Vitis vinifera]
KMRLLAVILLALVCLSGISAQQCGRQARGKRCAGGLCCSQYGYCGTALAPLGTWTLARRRLQLSLRRPQMTKMHVYPSNSLTTTIMRQRVRPSEQIL